MKALYLLLSYDIQKRFVFLFFFFCLTINANCQTAIDNLTQKFELNKQSVLLIYTANDTSGAQGTAFLIGPDGLALSNYHVFENSTGAVAYDYQHNKFNDISIIYSNPYLDYIIFRVNGCKLPHLNVATKQPLIGESCFAIGNPKGLELTLSIGIISGYRDNDDLIQTTTEITNGSSGGPLFNRDGDVIGVTTFTIGQAANLNFALNLIKINLNDNANNTTITPENVVRQFLTCLGNKEFNQAYSLSDNPLWQNNGGLPWFKSKYAYGGIKSVKVYNIQTEMENNYNAKVYAHYFADDPLHESKAWEQYYYLEKRQGRWVIVSAKLKM